MAPGWIQHYHSSQKILLVGEGDFSFSACLAKAFGSADNMAATSLLSKEMLLFRHLASGENLCELERRGCLVLHEVDVRNMNQHATLRNMKFDIIIYNFPHAGHSFGFSETSKYMILNHKDLIRAYFTSAREMLRVGGEIHVTHRDDHPYNKWEVENLAEEAGLHLKEKVQFHSWNYPGYRNRRGSRLNGDGDFPLRECFTFKFTLRMN